MLTLVHNIYVYAHTHTHILYADGNIYTPHQCDPLSSSFSFQIKPLKVKSFSPKRLLLYVHKYNITLQVIL